MARDVDKDQEHIYNGNKFMVNTGEGTGVFHRDVDKLFHQYRNLRMSIFSQFKDYLPDPVSQDELRSYIDEQFIRLVKEFDINGPVDFPGYIKTKLTYRVKHSYIKGEYRDRQRVFVTRNDLDVSNLLERSPMMDEGLDYYEALEYALQGVELSELERLILYYTLQELSDTEIEKEVKENYKGKEKLSKTYVKDKVKDMQTFLKERLKDSLRQ